MCYSADIKSIYDQKHAVCKCNSLGVVNVLLETGANITFGNVNVERKEPSRYAQGTCTFVAIFH